MSEWRRRWEISYRWRREVAPGRRVNSIVDTAEQLRACVEWALANPDVESYTVASRRDMVGERPQQCGNGHTYIGAAFKPRVDWQLCDCGGHALYRCRTSGCDDVTVDPPVGPGCEPVVPLAGETMEP